MNVMTYPCPIHRIGLVNTLRPRQNGRHFADDTFKCIFLNENFWIPIKISVKFVPKGPINNILALVQIMAWRRPGDKPLSEPMMVRLTTHICVTRPQWVKLQQQKKQSEEGYRCMYKCQPSSWVPMTCGVTWRSHVLANDSVNIMTRSHKIKATSCCVEVMTYFMCHTIEIITDYNCFRGWRCYHMYRLWSGFPSLKSMKNYQYSVPIGANLINCDLAIILVTMVPGGIKPSPESLLTNCQLGFVVFTWGLRKYARYLRYGFEIY